HIGRILDALEQRGLLQDTVIVFTSDHGDYLGDYGLWGKGLPTYESMQRIPFIVAHPHCATAGQKSPALQSLVDIEATICDIAGMQADERSQGMSQQSTWIDSTRSVRQRALIEFRPSQGSFKQHTWITGQYKYVRYRQRDYGELYDLEKDPHQLHNLFDEPEAISVRRQFDSECRIAEKDERVRERTAIA
ncbi:sulfatase-like hydrolase/transferase, partial [candidate division KSB1 bacterium]|nr:sulfatase-like hydrolase/transferase [candidate division KSB1 bacterium]